MFFECHVVLSSIVNRRRHGELAGMDLKLVCERRQTSVQVRARTETRMVDPENWSSN